MGNVEKDVTRGFRTQDVIYCGLFAALMTVGALIKIVLPIGVFEVTVSLQVFFALLAGFLLGARNGFLSIVVYLIIGLIGVPVFAHGGGLGYLIKPTFGFLIGFAFAALFAGLLTNREKKPRFSRLAVAALVGEMAYYACGLIYYFIMFNFVLSGTGGIGIAKLFSVWFLSTVIPDTVICMLAAVLAYRLVPIMRRMQG
ncbi:hypothetical protein HMPREF0380_00248 [Eubacterium infirmum F0142]|jgi:bioY protein|nr:hypothetical protein HMPREF0380_00248 [Eubacterium infirmum F0142]